MSFNLEQQKEQQSTFSHLGNVVWWTLRDVEIKQEKLKEEMEKLELSTKHLPRVPSDIVAIQRTIRKVNKKDGDGQEYLFRPIITDPGNIIFGIVKEEANKQEEELNYILHNRVRLRAYEDSKELSVEHLDRLPYQNFIDVYDEVKSILSADDIRKMTGNILSDCQSVTIRQSGGVYFIPREFDGVVQSMERLFSILSDGSKFWSLGVIDVPNARSMIFELFKQEIISKLDNLLVEIGNMDKEKSQARNYTGKTALIFKIDKEIQAYMSLIGVKTMPENLAAVLKLCKDKLKENQPIRML